MASRTRINPLSVLFVLGILAYGLYTINEHGRSQQSELGETVNGQVTDSLETANPSRRSRWPKLPGFGRASGESKSRDSDSAKTTPVANHVDEPPEAIDGHPATDIEREQPAVPSESSPAVGRLIAGRVVKILDGDTVDILLNDQNTARLRLDGIDAPERGQPYSTESRRFLGQLCHDRPVFAMILDQDRYGRWIADIYQQNTWVNGEMVKSGLAWHYRQYNDSPDLAALERAAQERRVGVWRDARPMAPWDYRRQKRDGSSRAPASDSENSWTNTRRSPSSREANRRRSESANHPNF